MNGLLALLVLLLPRQDPGISLDLAREAFGEAEEAALEDGGKLWGQELLGALLFADPATRAVAANPPDEEGRLVEKDGVFAGTLPPEIGIANTAVEWAGVRWTMVAWPLPAERHERVRLLMHESFHRIQPRLAHGGSDPLSTHLDTEAGRTWLRLEYRALAAALAGKDEARADATLDALLFRARRRAAFPDAAGKESAFERNEGLAEYTGFALCGLAGGALAERVAAKLRRDETSASFVRSFAYATGPAWGVLLDQTASGTTGWREAIDARADLSALLARALAWQPPAELEQAAADRAPRYGASEIAAAERARAAERATLDARNRARFVDGPFLALPWSAKASYSFDPNDITPLEPAGSVYGTLYLVDEWGVLDVKTGGALIVRNPAGIAQEARVSAPADTGARPVAGDGWSLTLNEGWTLAPGARSGDWKIVRGR
jgi:hypothetical protein